MSHELSHGLSGYKNRGCRCEVCRKAASVFWSERCAQRRALGICRECPAPVHVRRDGRAHVRCLKHMRKHADRYTARKSS